MHTLLKTPLSALLTASLILPTLAGAAPPDDPEKAKPGVRDDRSWVVIEAQDRETRTLISNCGIAIDSVAKKQVEGVASPRALECLRAAGIQVKSSKPLESFTPQDFPPQDSTYHNVERMNKEFASIQSAMPGSSLSSIGKTWQGRSIQVLRLGTQGKPAMLLMGTHHAREHLSTEVPLGIASWLAANRNDPNVAHALQNRAIYIMPVVNPDGMEYDIATGKYRWYRKNMRNNGDGTTGVDLNRNYDWAYGSSGSSTYPGSDTYQGPSAFSEPESIAVRDFLRSHKDITTIISYHSSGAQILYPWSYAYDPVPEPKAAAAFKGMSDKMGQLTGYESMQSAELYTSGGDTCDWAWGELKMFCVTIELEGGGFYPGASAIGPAVDKNVKAAMYLLDISDDPYRAGRAEAEASVHRSDLDKTTDGKVGGQSREDAARLQTTLGAVGQVPAQAPRSFDGKR